MGIEYSKVACRGQALIQSFRPLVLMACATLPSIQACNSADFGGSQSANAPGSSDCKSDDADCDPSSTPPQADASPGTEDCSQGDKLDIPWSGAVKECLIDQGRTYNFEQKKCTEMKQATFSCSWDTVIKQLDDRGLLSSVLESDSKSGAKLVTCGQSTDGNRIVVQWVSLPESGEPIDCKRASTGASITTGCYTLYKQGESRPPEATTDEERAQQVYDCMNQL